MAELTKYVDTDRFYIGVTNGSLPMTDSAIERLNAWLRNLFITQPRDYSELGCMIADSTETDQGVIEDWVDDHGGDRHWASCLVAERIQESVAVPPEIKVGTYIIPEKWGVIGSCLKAGEPGFCDFYLPTNSGGPIKEVAVNVKVTGRQPRWWMSDHWWRIRITFVHDGEPNTTTGGWVKWRQE